MRSEIGAIESSLLCQNRDRKWRESREGLGIPDAKYIDMLDIIYVLIIING